VGAPVPYFAATPSVFRALIWGIRKAVD